MTVTAGRLGPCAPGSGPARRMSRSTSTTLRFAPEKASHRGCSLCAAGMADHGGPDRCRRWCRWPERSRAGCAGRTRRTARASAGRRGQAGVGAASALNGRPPRSAPPTKKGRLRAPFYWPIGPVCRLQQATDTTHAASDHLQIVGRQLNNLGFFNDFNDLIHGSLRAELWGFCQPLT